MKIMLDCGYYAGVASRSYGRGWKIYAFEPNPEIKADRRLIRKAVWVDDKGVDLTISTRHNASFVNNLVGGDGPVIKVKSIDFSKFVSELPESEIHCSMDIEGSEFPVLEKMLADDSIKRISDLTLELHDRLSSTYDLEDSKDLVLRLLNTGIKLKLTVPLW